MTTRGACPNCGSRERFMLGCVQCGARYLTHEQRARMRAEGKRVIEAHPKLLAALAHAPDTQQQPWIWRKVEDELPPVGVTVLVWYDGKPSTAWLEQGGSWLIHLDQWRCLPEYAQGPTHWAYIATPE
jgi:hypothetical protein